MRLQVDEKYWLKKLVSFDYPELLGTFWNLNLKF